MSRCPVRPVSAVVCGLAILGSVLPAAAAGKAKFNRVVNIGDKAPAWTGLKGVDGQTHGLADHKDAKAAVVVFTCNHCPVAQAYEKRLIRFTADYKPKGVDVVAISVSTFPPDRFEKMQEHAKERGFNFPYLADPSQKIGREYGATCTPHVFLLDKDRRIAYMGRIDDNLNESSVEKRDLIDAVEALLSGKPPEVAETRAVGCEIDYETE